VVVSALFTVWENAGEFVLPLKLPLPVYSAVIEWDATLSALVERVAWPPLNAPVPKVVAPSLKVTDPVGVPLPGETAETVAVNVTDWPDTEVFCDEETAIVVFALLTVCENTGELVLPFTFESPTYSAVMECDATVNAAVENVA
jgi:hypothetical protein